MTDAAAASVAAAAAEAAAAWEHLVHHTTLGARSLAHDAVQTVHHAVDKTHMQAESVAAATAAKIVEAAPQRLKEALFK